ncbi:MAG: methyltransferase domain-containing protein [Burkholderiales bacterium]|nr:methyltransferase domain-containing protein [Nitrosomonas sp.]MCP5274682.1 methyltransferase domain-containing protein [Burkholderiales bacterium]
MPLSSTNYDVVYSIAALEHVVNPTGVIKEIHRLLRPGGLAIHEIDLKHHGSSDHYGS